MSLFYKRNTYYNFRKAKNTRVAARGFLRFSQVSQHPACLDQSIQTRKTIRYFFNLNSLSAISAFLQLLTSKLKASNNSFGPPPVQLFWLFSRIRHPGMLFKSYLLFEILNPSQTLRHVSILLTSSLWSISFFFKLLIILAASFFSLKHIWNNLVTKWREIPTKRNNWYRLHYVTIQYMMMDC